MVRKRKFYKEGASWRDAGVIIYKELQDKKKENSFGYKLVSPYIINGVLQQSGLFPKLSLYMPSCTVSMDSNETAFTCPSIYRDCNFIRWLLSKQIHVLKMQRCND